MKKKRRSQRIALLLVIAILLSLFVAIAMVMTMSGCSSREIAGLPEDSGGKTVTSPAGMTRETEVSAIRSCPPSSSSPPTSTLNAPKPTLSKTSKTLRTTTAATSRQTESRSRASYGPPVMKAPGAVALTFDDGPGQYTGELLDALKEYGVKATFFVQGQFAEQYPGLIRRMHQEGHGIGNHTYSHRFLSETDEATRRSQLARTSDAIERITGVRPRLMRPPGGYRNGAVFREAGRQGMAAVFWDIDTADWKYKDSQYVYNYLLNHTAAGKIILMHDTHKTTVDGFIRALPVLLDHGFTFVTVDELVELRPGEVYPLRWR